MRCSSIRNPGRSRNAEGSTDLVLVFEDIPVHREVRLDNLGSRYFGPFQVTASVTSVPGFLPGQQLSLTGTASVPPDEMKTVSASYLMPLNSFGTTATLTVSYGHTHPGYQLKPLDVVGDTSLFGLSFNHPLIRSRAQDLYVGGSFQAKQVSTDSLDQKLYEDRIREVGLSVSYSLLDAWNGINAIGTNLSQGLNILGADGDRGA